jgi:hypothetical protein
MLGFVNGRSCVHKSKPRGLVNKKTGLPLLKSGAKLVKYFDIFIFYMLLVNICQHRQHL